MAEIDVVTAISTALSTASSCLTWLETSAPAWRTRYMPSARFARQGCVAASHVGRCRTYGRIIGEAT